MEKKLYDKLNELCFLYEKVKLSIILLENFDEKREMYIAPMNQLRSTLDHIFKAVSIAPKTIDSDYELKEAREHLERAGYDALELLAGSLGTSIINKLRPYDTKTLTSVYPEYFTSIKPKITGIQQSVAERRMERKIDSDKSFLAYFAEIVELVDINKSVDRMIPSLQEYCDKNGKEKRKDYFWKIVIGLISVVTGYLLSKIKWGCF
jgi:hypothetical protein